MDNEIKDTKEKEIDLVMLWTVLKKCFVWVILAALLCALAAGIVTQFVTHTTYVAQAKFWVNNSSSNYDYTSIAMQQGASTLAQNYTELINEADRPLQVAVQKGELDAYFGCTEAEAVRRLRGMVKAGVSSETTCIFTVTVKGDNITDVAKTANAINSSLSNLLIDEFSSIKINEDNKQLVSPLFERITNVYEVKPPMARNALIGAVVGAFLVYLVFFVKKLLDTRIYSETNIKDAFAQPILGSVPHWQTEGDNKNAKSRTKEGIDVSARNYKDKLIGEKTPFAVNEAFNTIRTSVTYSSDMASTPVVAVTSPYSGDGKSVVASNIALSFAAAGKRVLLVGCDMRCPSLRRVFGGEGKEGLLDLLTGLRSSTAEVVCHSRFENLDILYAGQIPPNPSELLSHARFGTLVEEWRADYDIVILDTPPICEVADAGIIAQYVSGYILTVRSATSDIRTTRTAIGLLTGVGGRLMGFVLNDVNPKFTEKYQYKGYYYANSRYAELSHAPEKPEEESTDRP